MPDPLEGIGSDGTIRTGARRDRVPALFEKVVRRAIAGVEQEEASLYLYGSVANGSAEPGSSDVDLLSINLPNAQTLAARLSHEFAALCRGVEVAIASTDDFLGETDEAYGNRVFLRHYCVHLAGPDHAADLPSFPADVRAARGFNGDIEQHLARWRADLAVSNPEALGIRIARKTLLAVAGLVSVHDRIWTTNRPLAARRWAEIEPRLGIDLDLLASWSDRSAIPTRRDVSRILDPGQAVPITVGHFKDRIGVWDTT